MGRVNIEGVKLSELKNIYLETGNIYHALKKSDESFSGFGEAYFSTVNYKAIKAWKKHKEMVCNLIVPVGKVLFVLYDDREKSITKNSYYEVELSLENYYRLTIPPGVWTGFQGLSENLSVILNIASIEHNPEEVDRLEIENIPYQWKKSL